MMVTSTNDNQLKMSWYNIFANDCKVIISSCLLICMKHHAGEMFTSNIWIVIFDYFRMIIKLILSCLMLVNENYSHLLMALRLYIAG